MQNIISLKSSVLFLGLTLVLIVCSMTSSWAEERSASEVAHELSNPNNSLGSLSFNLDYISYDGDIRDADEQDAWQISFQPIFPYPLAKDTNFFLRPLIPLILDQPVPDADGFDDEGVDLGDIAFDVAIGKGFSNGFQLIGGITGSLDTATNDALGSGQTRLGPEIFLGQKTDWGFYGALFTHVWDVAGDDYATSITGGQYFYAINLKDAWQIEAQPTWSYDYQADDSDDKLTFPLGIGVAKTAMFGKTPVKFALEYWNYIESPDAFGPEHQVRLQVTPVVPLPW